MLLILGIIFSLILFLFELLLKTHKTYGMNRLVRKYIYRTVLAEFFLLGISLDTYFLNIIRAGGPEIYYAYGNITGGPPMIIAGIGFLIDYYFEEIDRKLYLRENRGPFTVPLFLIMFLVMQVIVVASGIHTIKIANF